MWRYQNGDYTVTLADDGTKTRVGEGVPIWPESMDIKLTNKCDGVCSYCYEDSRPDGKSADLEDVYSLLYPAPRGVEFAFGGGNPLEVDVDWLFNWLAGVHGHICNLTINARHIEMFESVPESWTGPDEWFEPNAVGISYDIKYHHNILRFAEEHRNCVIHLIAGEHTLSDLRCCLRDFPRVLVLGYKSQGRGGPAPAYLKTWEREIGMFLGRKMLIFDNLAVQQLDVKRFFTPEHWDEMYMGDDGEFTMYLDMVERRYAVSSTRLDQYPIGNKTVPEMFAHVRSIRGE